MSLSEVAVRTGPAAQALSVTEGRILGHEGVGVVEQVGEGVSIRKGDRVLISCITSCGKCDFCKKGMYSHCRNGGWIPGNAAKEHALKVILQRM